MSEYIERNALIKKIHRDYGFSEEWAKELAFSVPAVDVAPVIRCKDCVHKVTGNGGKYNPQDIVCDYWNTDGLEDNGFCYNGVIGKYDESENCYSLLDEKMDEEDEE